MSNLKGLLNEAVSQIIEYENQNESLKKNLENSLEEAQEAVRASKKAEEKAIASAELFGPPGYIILYRSTDYGDNTPGVSWFRTKEDAELFIRWCNETNSEWIEPIGGQSAIKLADWLLIEAKQWDEPGDVNPFGRAALLKSLEK